ncbi:hypothetical protein ABH935_006592 [Catenulispora sp. GAS73]
MPHLRRAPSTIRRARTRREPTTRALPADPPHGRRRTSGEHPQPSGALGHAANPPHTHCPPPRHTAHAAPPASTHPFSCGRQQRRPSDHRPATPAAPHLRRAPSIVRHARTRREPTTRALPADHDHLDPAHAAASPSTVGRQAMPTTKHHSRRTTAQHPTHQCRSHGDLSADALLTSTRNPQPSHATPAHAGPRLAAYSHTAPTHSARRPRRRADATKARAWTLAAPRSAASRRATPPRTPHHRSRPTATPLTGHEAAPPLKP